MREALRHLGGVWVWANRHAFDPDASQTRAPRSDSVGPEGGGTHTPTLGGGFFVTRARGNMEGGAP